MTHTFSAEQWLPFPADLAFLFFSNPENLPRLMPAWQKARIEQATFVPPPPAPAGTPKAPGILAGVGTRMTLSFRAVPLLPLRLPWDAEISEFVWNDHFCDVIAGRGPFRSWRHCHHLAAAANPGAGSSAASMGTLLRDQVEYTLPFGPLGELGNAVLVRRQLAATFRYRHRRTAELLPRFVASSRPA